MDDPPPDRPLTRSEKWTVGVFMVVILGLFTAELATNYHPVKLSVLFIVLFWGPLLALHEVGHAVAAKAVGWEVEKVVIGFGRTVTELRIRNVPVEIRLLPLEGFVRPVPTNLKHPRLKNAFVYFAGPGAELVLGGLVVLIAGTDTLLERTPHLPTIGAQALLVAVLMGLFFNLIPHSVQTRKGVTANDGLGIIRSLTLPLSHFDDNTTEPGADEK